MPHAHLRLRHPPAGKGTIENDRNLLRHISPIEWRDIILYGETGIDPAKMRTGSP
ncbi:MAG: hypothetical protein OXI87_24935 [Albidovulum sp.]|nr:hypothetical protein [Albidovulum sp.]MDE0308102.1 hypothetical protein [Albidovulum sp.]MDE0532976.1 hypothetical protein [Albidovulum sp.]